MAAEQPGPMQLQPIGGAPIYQRGKMHDFPLATKRATVEKYGLGFVVGLAPQEPDPGWVQLHEEGALRYVLAPIPDGQIVGNALGFLWLLAAAVTRQAKPAGLGVLGHCAGGRNRSGLFNALMLREWTGCSGAEAVAIVKAARPTALENEEFVAWLSALPAVGEAGQVARILPTEIGPACDPTQQELFGADQEGGAEDATT